MQKSGSALGQRQIRRVQSGALVIDRTIGLLLVCDGGRVAGMGQHDGSGSGKPWGHGDDCRDRR
jgi:hypothetical protein